MSGLGNKEIMAKNIKYYMDKFGVDRKKLSTDLDIKYTTLTDWLKAKTYPRIDKIELLANYFNISKSDLVEEASSDISSIYNQLDERRQKRVYNFAQTQLQEQQENKISPMESKKSDSEEIHTLAAHSSDPDHVHTDEEIAELEAYLDELDKEYDKKQAKRDKWHK